MERSPLLATLTCLLCLFFSLHLRSQPSKLWGLTADGGGPSGMGTLFSINSDGTGFNKLHVFNSDHAGIQPVGTPLLASDGKFYGMTKTGGGFNEGILYSYDTGSQAYTVIYAFNDTTGYNPVGSLIQANNGIIYGLTSAGNACIFSYNISSSLFNIVYTFKNDSTGHAPGGSLMQFTDGKLYGVASAGGSNGTGLIFSYDILQNVYNVVYSFGANQPALPNCTLAMGPAGNLLYGMTNYASYSRGTLFSFSPGTNAYDTLLDFTDTTLTYPGTPYGQLVVVSSNIIYGLAQTYNNFTYNYVSYIFRADINKHTITMVDNIDNTSGMTLQNNGKLYCLSALLPGVLFSLDTSSTAPNRTVLETINVGPNDSSGITASGAPVITPGGNFYWTFGSGGIGNRPGGVFCKYNSNSKLHTKLFNFNSSDGANPGGSLLKAMDGKFYGMTSYGGVFGYGTIFSYEPSAGVFSTRYNFNGVDGFNAYTCNLIQLGNGMMYGVTQNGGTHRFGSLFSFDPDSNTVNLLYSFDGTLGNSVSSLVQSFNGRLYGVANKAIYSFNTDSSTFSVVHLFNTAEKSFYGIDGTMILGSDSNLYGVSDKCVFSFNPDSGTVRDLSFYPPNAYSPYYGVTQVKSGLLYGSMPVRYGPGYLYTCDPVTGNYNETQSTTAGSGGAFLLGQDGKLYALDNIGGGGGFTSISNPGYIYRYDPVTLKYDTLLHLGYSPGYSPSGNLIETTGCNAIQTLHSAAICQGDTFMFNGKRLTQKGTYNDTLTAQNTCDSISTVQVTVNALPVKPVITPSGNVLSATAASKYQWYINNNPVAADTTQSIPLSGAGPYVVQITDSNGCVATSIPFTITGTNALTGDILQVFPNPSAAGNWQLLVGNSLVGSKLEIFDAEGRMVLNSEITNQREEINLNVAPGVYLLQVSSPVTNVPRKLIKL